MALQQLADGKGGLAYPLSHYGQAHPSQGAAELPRQVDRWHHVGKPQVWRVAWDHAPPGPTDQARGTYERGARDPVPWPSIRARTMVAPSRPLLL